MTNKKNWLEMMVLILTFGVTVVGCNVDRRLNGTWIEENGHFKVKYNSGNFEVSDENGTLINKGTYTTSDGKITNVRTHFNGTILGLDSKLYTKNELEAAKKDDEQLNETLQSIFQTTSGEYTVTGNTLTFTWNDDYKETLTREGKSSSTVKSSGSAFAVAGRWSLEDGPKRNNPEEMELLKDGTGIVDGAGITWKIENGRFYLIHPLIAFSSIYNVSSSTLTLTKDDGVKLVYKKK